MDYKIKGYKAFNKEFKNIYGDKFECDKEYYTPGEIGGKFCNGFHFSKKFEETFRFFDFDDNAILTEVECSGKIFNFYDEYYDYDIYSCSNIKIIRIIPRNEIIKMIEEIDYSSGIEKVISTFPLKNEEFEYLMNSKKNKYFNFKMKLMKEYDKRVKKLIKNMDKHM